MVAGKRNRHHDDRALTTGTKLLQHDLGTRSQPPHRPDIRLEAELVRIRNAQAFHHRSNAGRNFGRIGVTAIDNAKRQRMRTEKNQRVITIVGRHRFERSSRDECHAVDEAVVQMPAIDHAPVKPLLQSSARERAMQLVQR